MKVPCQKANLPSININLNNVISPKFPENENERLNAVKQYGLLDTLAEKDFDNITNLIATLCEVPISLITLLDTDRNFLKSHHGIPFNESPREISFCGHAILSNDDIFVIEDARLDERFHDNPLVKEFNAIFYAGVPLVNPDGYKLGTLCVYDHKPKHLTKIQRQALITIGKQVVNLFELIKKNRLLDNTLEILEERNSTLKSFANQVSHDLKSPLANIKSLTCLFKDECANVIPESSLEYLHYIEESADTLRAYIDGLLKHYKAEELINNNADRTKLNKIYNAIKSMLSLHDKTLILKKDIELKNVNIAVLTQVLFNLVDNALKYNHSENPKVFIEGAETSDTYTISVSDNGIGIDENKQDKLFDLFSTLTEKDKMGKKGTGIGLYTVKTLVNKIGGTIQVNSVVGKGSTFTITIKKQ